ncbi:Txe/YoeB family addiction module toxin [Lactiplantibacillus sp. WILCCON 0030]|uniref:Endoribonuclease YoeB n=1 Tax=Lactiplantibacillus brownii TaxID=3069269 RepID=A0ABU1ABD0_9LACO|nr:Txe/YoeB family addiction module toxin [Lactiplantibacillus brownii]MDQ7938216.1 Txe/YoeB family addiction module toxin [Lactiplantibacillus brownii]
MYTVVIKNSAKADLKMGKESQLVTNFLTIIAQLKQDPYFPNQSLEKLTPPASGLYSRRLNIHHRVVYTIDHKTKTVVIYSAWNHYA